MNSSMDSQLGDEAYVSPSFSWIEDLIADDPNPSFAFEDNFLAPNSETLNGDVDTGDEKSGWEEKELSQKSFSSASVVFSEFTQFDPDELIQKLNALLDERKKNMSEDVATAGLSDLEKVESGKPTSTE